MEKHKSTHSSFDLMQQITNHVLMVRPAAFGYNEETADSNSFQREDESRSTEEVVRQAQKEFDQFVAQLRSIGVSVTVVEDTTSPIKPDAVFPNNWVSTHPGNQAILYPMQSTTRRQEVRPEILSYLYPNQPPEIWDLREVGVSGNKHLEGTGSLILDRVHRIAYACESPRTDRGLFDLWCQRMEFTGIYFTATDSQGQEIYHTNVMMALGERFAVVCTASIADEEERTLVLNKLDETGHEVIPISFAQMNAFAGNILQLRNDAGKRYIIMSDRAFKAFDDPQRAALGKYGDLVVIPLDVIEICGGGGVRCMMAEVFV